MKRLSLLLMIATVALGVMLPAIAQDDTVLPLAEPGEYAVGRRLLTLVDEARFGREIPVYVFYPVVAPPDHDPNRTLDDAPPAAAGVPYPLVLYSGLYDGVMSEIRPVFMRMVSHGFVGAAVIHPNTDSVLTYVDRPLDLLFALDQLTALNETPDDLLAGAIDTEHVGVLGAGTGSYTAYLMAGARVQVESASSLDDIFGLDYLRSFYFDWDWDRVASYHDRHQPPAENGLWPAMTDPRIRAVMTYMPCDSWYIGEQGLAAATLPTLTVATTENEFCGYVIDTGRVATMLGSEEADILTLRGLRYLLPSDRRVNPILSQYATAFFGYHLQGNEDYAQYLTAEYTETIENALWGLDLATMEAFSFNPGPITTVDRGVVPFDEPVTGEIALGTRDEFTLTLTDDTAISVHVASTGVNAVSPAGTPFEPFLFIYDSERTVLAWGDLVPDPSLFAIDWEITDLQLPAGTYTIGVRGVGDIAAGPYELMVELPE